MIGIQRDVHRRSAQRLAPARLRAEVHVETMILRLIPDGSLAYRVLRTSMQRDDVSPDEVALALSGARDIGSVCHSTSWRWQDGRTVMTYAVLPDPDPDQLAVPLANPSVLTSGDPLRPTPERLHEHHVAAHAVRHLDYLAATDPSVAATVPENPSLWAAIHAASLDMRVGTYAEVHP